MLRNLITVITLILGSALALSSQSIVTEFGKNRVQHHDDHYNWARYETENFVTYWYGKGRSIAQPVIQLAELDHEEIQKNLEHTLSRKIEVIVYTDQSDLKQSNIGAESAFTNQSKTTKVDGNKIMVYFDGNHQHLRTQVKKGIAQVYMNSILFGSNIQEVVQNAILLNLPPWFSDGLVAFAGSNWDRYIEDEIRDLMTNEDFHDFEKFADHHPRAAGHSLWNYIEQKYGSSTIPNIIYLTRISRNLENSFLFILGVEYSDLLAEWSTFYQNYYRLENGQVTETEDLNLVKLKNKKGVPVSKYRLSSDGRHLAYVTNDRSKTRVVVRDLETEEERTVLKIGYKNIFQEPDYNYPLIAWHPNYPELSVVYEKRDIVKLKVIDVKNQEEELTDMTTNFQRIYSLDYITADQYLMSATTDGYSDLYIYKSENRHHTRITDDFYDDLEASVITYENRPAILFRSNRPSQYVGKEKLDTILPVANFDLFIMKGFEMDSPVIQLTETKHISERQAFQSAADEISFIHGHSGIDNIYTLDLKTKEIVSKTNLERNVIHHHTVPGSPHHFYNYYYKGNYVNVQDDLKTVSKKRAFKTQLAHEKQKEENEVLIPFLPNDENPITATEGMKFQSPFDDPENLKPVEQTQNEQFSSSMFEKYFKDYYSGSYLDGKRIVRFEPMRSSASRERFRLDDFITKLDNTVLFEGLESYTGDDKELNAQPTGILFKGVIKDLLEDYSINVGLRIPTTFTGYEYFITLDDNKRLWDKRIAFYSETENSVAENVGPPEQREKRRTFLGLYRLKYPFDVYQSIRFTGSLRFDKFFLQATEQTSFESDFTFEKRLSLKTEYVFDNSYEVSLNILNGSRAKAYVEVINEFDLDLVDGLNIDPHTALTTVIGMDARHYIPIFKRAVLALRATAATSFGSQRVVYYLGGVEGWIGASAEENIPVPSDANTSFKVQAPHLRGFRSNIRNGNSYALTNSELRVPVAHFLGLERSRLGFVRNLQLTSFFDAGVAWFGANPNSEDNTLNTINVNNPEENPSIIIEARFFRDPLVYGYGFGMRSTILGYFFKIDYGWGVETGHQREPRLYFSLGLDF